MEVYAGREHPGSPYYVRIEAREHGLYNDREKAEGDAKDIARDHNGRAYRSGNTTEQIWPLRL